jgi:hypothetical protein
LFNNNGEAPNLDDLPDDLRQRIESGEGGQGGGMRQFNRMLSGTITAIDGDTLTITAADGTETTVTTSTETAVSEVASGTLADLAVGDEVSVASDPTAEGDDTLARSITKGDLAAAGFGPVMRPAGPTPTAGS